MNSVKNAFFIYFSLGDNGILGTNFVPVFP